MTRSDAAVVPPAAAASCPPDLWAQALAASVSTAHGSATPGSAAYVVVCCGGGRRCASLVPWLEDAAGPRRGGDALRACAAHTPSR